MEELADGDLDGEAFRRRTQGLRLGVVVDGEDVWMYDSVGRRWVYGDGARLSTYATDRAPHAAGDPPPDPAERLDRDRGGDRDRGRDRAGTEEQGRPEDLDHTVTRIVNRDGSP